MMNNLSRVTHSIQYE